ncbi:sigma-54-dependent transcriptional regulator [Desulfosudis oleivorans]|nr:sigma-54 dependent transcriptional regulator [Desulfosudis oleivorans]
MADILVIDDDESVCRLFARAISRMGHRADAVLTLGEGMDKIKSGLFDLVLLDVRLPDGNGLAAVPAILKGPGEPEVIIITGQGDADGAEMATRSGAWAYVEKPPVMDQLTLHIRRALEFRDQKSRARLPLVMKRDRILGSSPAITECLGQAALASASDVNVLVTGETGTGKELFARAIHQNSRRGQSPFVAVDCAALSETLAESILFGHVKGAFTDADRDRKGLIREADGGTLLLDEVGELSLELQKSFLRVLQEKRVRPVGLEKEIDCDFRLIAATNRDLDKMAAQGSFRSDLLYRIRTFTIKLPPLRQRGGDFKELAVACIHDFCERENIEVKSVSPDFFETLAAYAWPGNVRELISAIESALSVARFAPMLYSRHLPEEIRVHQARKKVDSAEPGTEGRDRNSNMSLPPLKKVRDDVVAQTEKSYLADLMRITGGKVSEACRVSGLSRSRLYTLLKKYGIQ